MRGSRVQAVVDELQGEKIDIIPWSADVATFIVNALAPAEVAKVVLDEERERIEVVVPDEQLSLAIGRRGQNVRLASQLTGWDIDILTEEEESERRQKEFEKRTKMFMDALNVDEVVGQLLASEGFSSVEELAMVDQKDIASIEGFDEETASEMQARAQRISRPDRGRATTPSAPSSASRTSCARWPASPRAMLVAFGENDIKTVEDLAGCATDDLVGWTERKDGEAERACGLPRRLRAVPRGGRGADHAGPRQGRLDRGRLRRRRPRRQPPRPQAEPNERQCAAGMDRWTDMPSDCDDADARTLDRGPRDARLATAAPVRRDPRGPAGRRADPLRRRAGRRCRARSQAPPAGPRRLGHGARAEVVARR